ncbi:bifunctional UDP-sugar hydrolase/5'-nucleotidase [Robiginitalea sp. SC105]|uniref:bifunctional metallophosphatase/5'-nucleotidase n=1 Tax=Robiginitalea sp. SC105 TaxID=2762332 RepID=UPI00163950BD|nr:metallophosphatase [Robiginitalea sp. SC105]MBC2840773.1 metallophosphatase [Robiginitalea sp. SC105]
MKRRNFLKTGASAGAALGLAGLNLASCSSFGRKQITILHTNDVHSHIDPFPPNHAAFPNLGGAARRAGLIASIREENPNTLLLDAGDIFQGTPYFNFYGGELEFRLMSRMNYQAATLGNHDFDNGIGGLMAQLPYADFRFVSANYDFRNTDLHGYVDPYMIHEVDGIRVGIFGLGIELEGLVLPDLYGETRYLDPVEQALDTARILREEAACNLVVCLSHLGYRYEDPTRVSDVVLARRTEGIDLIIGGHTHTFMETAQALTNRAGGKVLINQVGCFGINLGRVDFFLEPGGAKEGSGVSISV